MTGDRASWNNRTCALFLDLIIEQKNQHHWNGKTLTSIGWQNVTRAFKNMTNLDYTKKQLQNKYNDLKGKYFTWRDGLVQSGLGRDPHTGEIAADPFWLAASTGDSSINVGSVYKRPQCCEQLYTLLGHTPHDRGELISAGGTQPDHTPSSGSPLTPEDRFDDPQLPPPAGQSAKRASWEYSVTSPRKKTTRSTSIDDCIDSLDEIIERRRNEKSRDASEAEELARVCKILKEDGFSEGDREFARALTLCADKTRRRCFLALETTVGRQNWVSVMWDFVAGKFN